METINGWTMVEDQPKSINGWTMVEDSPKPPEPKIPGMEKLGALPPPASGKLPQERSYADMVMENEAGQQAAQLQFGKQLAENSPIEGVPEMLSGVKGVISPPAGSNRSREGRKIIGGAMKTATPLVVPAMIANPFGLAAGIAGGMAAQAATEAGLKKIGVNEDTAGLAGDVAGLAVPSIAGHAIIKGARPKPVIPEAPVEPPAPAPKPEMRPNDAALQELAGVEAQPEKAAVIQQQAAERGVQVPEGPKPGHPAARAAQTFSKAKTYAELFDDVAAQEKAQADAQAAARPAMSPEALQSVAAIEANPVKAASLRQQAAQRGVAVPETPQVISPAEQSAEAFQKPTYTELFDKAAAQENRVSAQNEAIAKKKASKPDVPETGLPEDVQRGIASRDRIARQLTGKPFEALSNPDRLTVDELVAEGNVGGARPDLSGPRTSPAPGKPLNRKPTGPPARQAALRATETKAPLEETAPPPAETPAPEPHKFSSTQVELPPDAAQKIREVAAQIPEEHLAEEGRENNPHITVKYGLHDETPEATAAALNGEGPIRAKLGKVSVFKNPDADVVKVDIESPDLHRLNGKVADAIEHTDTHPDYKPHATIAYVKPGMGEQYAKQLENAFGEHPEMGFDKVTFSGKDRTKTDIPLGSVPEETAKLQGGEPNAGTDNGSIIDSPADSAGPGEAIGGRGDGGLGEEQAIQQPVRPSRTAVHGAETEISIGGEGKKYPARYQVRELSEVYPSHDPFTFEPNPNYHYKNDRNYSDPVNQERLLRNSTRGVFEPAQVLTDNPTPGTGPSMIDPDGNVLGGNNRAILISRVYKNNPEGAAAYRNSLIQKAAHFGIDPNAIAGMKEPVLVREVPAEALADRAQRAISDFNKGDTAGFTASERASTDARMADDATVDYLARVLEAAGPDATLAQALSGPRGTEVVNALIDSGVFTGNDRPLLMDRNNEVTPAGRDRISKMLLGRLFRNTEQMDAAPLELKNVLERIASPITQVQYREGWDITPHLQDAIDFLKDLQARGGKNVRIGDTGKAIRDLIKMEMLDPAEVDKLFEVDKQGELTSKLSPSGKDRVLFLLQRAQENDLIHNQGNIEGQEVRQYSPEAMALARKLRENPNRILQAFRSYASDEQLSSPHKPMDFDFYEPPSPADAFNHAFYSEHVNPAERGSFSNKPAKQLTPAEQYAEELAAAREAARQEPTLRQKAGRVAGQLKDKFVDFNAPIEDLLARSQKEYGYEILPKDNITNQIDLALRAPTLAGQFVRDKGFDKIIEGIDNPEYLGQYMTAIQAEAVAKRGFNTGRDAGRDAALVKEFDNRVAIQGSPEVEYTVNGKSQKFASGQNLQQAIQSGAVPQGGQARMTKPTLTYKQVAQRINKFSQDLLDYSVDAGMISRDLAAHLKQLYPEYVPLKRVFAEVEKPAGMGTGTGYASLSSQSLLQRLAGSDREIENPIESILGQTAHTFAQGEKNKAAAMLAGYRSLPLFDQVIREVTGDPGTHAHTFSYLDNGQKRTFETTPEIAGAAKALNVQTLNIIGKILSVPTRLLKTGATGMNLPFMLANIVRDQWMAAITSGHSRYTSILNPKVFVHALTQAIGHGDLYDEMVRNGAGGTSFDISRNAPSQTVASLRSGRSAGSKIAYLARNPEELLRHAEDIVSRSEELTRLQQYEGTKQALLKQGRTPQDAEIMAAMAARTNTANFSRRGEWGTVLNATIPYLNAGIQGSRSHIAAFQERPAATAFKTIATIMLPAAMTTAWNLSSKEQEAAYRDIAEYEKENGLIIVPPNPTKDERGRWNVIKLPMPQGLAQLSIPVRRAIEQMHGMDPVRALEIGRALFSAVSPIDPEPNKIASSLTPQLIKPALESYTNRDFFTNSPVVPDRLAKLPAAQQVLPWTSGTARKAAGAMGASPIQVEHFIKSSTGGLGSQVLNASDHLLHGLGQIPANQIGGEEVPAAMAARFNKARGGEVDRREFTKLNTIETKLNGERAQKQQGVQQLFSDLQKMDPSAIAGHLTGLVQSGQLDEQGMKDLAKLAQATAQRKVDHKSQFENSLAHHPTSAKAAYVLQHLKTLPAEQRSEYLSDLYQRKVINDNTMLEMAKQAGVQQ